MLVGGVGCDGEAELVRRMLTEQGIDDRLVLPLDDRPTTLKERYIGRAQDRHPQQMIRVDYEKCDPIPALIETRLHGELDAALAQAEIVLISDYGKGVCTPTLLRAVIEKSRAAGVRVLADPIRSNDYSRYRGVHCMTPNRLEAQLATGMTIGRAEDAIRVGQKLVEGLEMEAVLVTLDREGMALVRADGRAEVLPTRPRQVYDITGAGDMVLAVVGLCLASGADYAEAAALGNVAGGLEVEKFGVALLTRDEIRRDLIEHHAPEGAKILDRDRLKDEVTRRHRAGQTIGFTNGCFDLLHPGHVRLLREAAGYCDFLAVGLNSDASVKRLKGASRPINPAEARAEVLSALEAVDAVTIFDEDTPLDLINAIRPDVLIKGGDYRPDQVVGRARGRSLGRPPGDRPCCSRATRRPAWSTALGTRSHPARRRPRPAPAPCTNRGASGLHTGRTSPHPWLECDQSRPSASTGNHLKPRPMLRFFARQPRTLVKPISGIRHSSAKTDPLVLLGPGCDRWDTHPG